MSGGDVALAPVSIKGAVTARRRRRHASRLSNLAIGVVVPIALLALWQVSASFNILPEQILPPPEAVAGVLRDGWNDGSLQANTLVSLGRVADGFLIGGVTGLVIGTALGLSGGLRATIQPLFLALAQVPILGWLPILILVSGLGDTPKVVAIGWSAFVPVVLNASQGISQVPRSFLELGQVLSFSRWSTLRSIILPAAVPQIFTGLREGLANGWQTLVAVELLGSFSGLGYMMAYGGQLFQLELVLAAVVVVGLIGVMLYLLLSFIERHLLRWQTGQS